MLKNFETTVVQKDLLGKANTSLLRANNIMGAMFDSVDTAFIVFNLEGHCTSSPSQVSKKFFSANIVGKHISEIIEHKDYSADELSSWYQLLVGGKHNFSSVCEIMPDTVFKNNKSLLLRFYPMLDENGSYSSVILAARDITSKLKAHEKVKTLEVRSSLILRVYQHRTEFRHFLKNYSKFINLSKKDSQLTLTKLASDLHTWKSLVRMNLAFDVADSIHECELLIVKSKKQGADSNETMATVFSTLQGVFQSWLSKNEQLFSSLNIFASLDYIEVPKKELELIKKFISENTAPIKNKKILSLFTHKELGQTMAGFSSSVQQISKSLNKPVKFHIQKSQDDIFLPRDAYKDVFNSFLHIFNNCIDHGIESKEERLAVNKPVEGELSVTYQLADPPGNKAVKIWVRDDGRGIDKKSLRNKLKENGYDLTKITSDEQLFSTIFDASISTKNTANQISGLGLGLNAFKSNVEFCGGSVRVLKSNDRGTTFEIVLPLQPTTDLLAA